MKLEPERLIHSTKTALACLIGVSIGFAIAPYGGQWITITILVVMCAQIYVGSVVNKSIWRLTGTLIGCLVASITLLLFGVSHTVVLIAIIISSFIFSYIATLREDLVYAGTLGAATTAIILLYPEPNIHTALLRCLEICTGIIIAALISQFILPIHARTHLRRLQAKTISHLRDYFKQVTTFSSAEDLHLEELDEFIVKSLIKQRQLAKESQREPFTIKFDKKVFLQILQAEKKILRSIIFIHQALDQLPHIRDTIITAAAFQDFTKKTLLSFELLIATLNNFRSKPKETLELPDIEALEADVYQTLGEYGKADLILINGLLFSMEILVQSIRELALLISISIEEEEAN